ncbi:MAG: hypothetical protein CVV19_19560, partial [Gammaproteobacteria bacterium HGW-Gammaproteobacteria-9]
RQAYARGGENVTTFHEVTPCYLFLLRNGKATLFCRTALRLSFRFESLSQADRWLVRRNLRRKCIRHSGLD